MTNKINKKGFIATIAIVLLSTGTLAFLVVTLAATYSYADGIERRELRIQNSLNEQACQETRPLIIAKDYFLDKEVSLSDLGCAIHK